MEFVLDASVVVKWFLSEPDSDRALEYRAGAVKNEIILHGTELVFFEVINAVWSKRVPAAVIKEVVVDLYRTPLRLHVFDQELAEETSRLAAGLGVTIYDVSYAALAKKIGCPLVTADEKMAKRLTDQGIEARIFGK